MQTFTLNATARSVIGHKVKHLRKQGLLPSTIYGKKIASESVTIPMADFIGIYEKAGETGLIELSFEGKVRPVLIHNVQKHPVSDEILHAELLQVNLKEKVHTHVPVEFIGVAPAVADKTGTLLALVDELEIEALPTDLPENISVDVSGLSQVNQEIKVKEITAPAGVTILTEPEVSLVRIGELVRKEAEEPVQEAATPAAETPGTEAAVPAEKTEPSEKPEA